MITCRAGAEYIVSADMSCLMHQKGCAERMGLDIKFIHIAQILNGSLANEAGWIMPKASWRFIANRKARRGVHDAPAVGFAQVKRDREAHGIPEWEELRQARLGQSRSTRSRIRPTTSKSSNDNAIRKMAFSKLHWARDAAEHNQIVYDILSGERRAKTLVKSKSMLTEECDMRPFLERRGIEVIETDLGERIQQLDDEPPSHIVVPAVHKLRGDVSACVCANAAVTEPGNEDVNYLAESQGP